MAEFGSEINLVALSVKGNLTEKAVSELTERIINRIGMNTAYPAMTYRYPLAGKGGNGFTFFQTITQSFICWDVYPDIGGGYVVICSCEPFMPLDVMDEIEYAGFTILDMSGKGLSLTDPLEAHHG